MKLNFEQLLSLPRMAVVLVKAEGHQPIAVPQYLLQDYQNIFDIMYNYFGEELKGELVQASKEEMFKHFDADSFFGIEGNCVESSDGYICRDGIVLGSEIIEKFGIDDSDVEEESSIE